MNVWYSVRRLLASTDEESYYMEEACAYFALALHDFFGYRIRMLIDNAQEDEWDGQTLPLVAHVYTVDSAGNAVDIKGKRSETDIRADFFDLVEPTIYDLTPVELEHEWMGDDLPLHAPSGSDVAEAKAVITANPSVWAPNLI